MSSQQAGEHVDRVVAHRERVPLVVVDHVDANALGIEVRRDQRVHDPADALHLGAVLIEAPDGRHLAVVRGLEESARLAVGRFGLVRRRAHLAFEQRRAVLLRLELGRDQHAVRIPRPAGLHLVAERDARERLRFLAALEPAAFRETHALSVDEDHVSAAPLRVAFHLLDLRPRRPDARRRQARQRQDPRTQESDHPSHLSTSVAEPWGRSGPARLGKDNAPAAVCNGCLPRPSGDRRATGGPGP